MLVCLLLLVIFAPQTLQPPKLPLKSSTKGRCFPPDSSVKRRVVEDLPWVGNALPASAAAELRLWSAWTLSVAAAGHAGAKRVAPFAGLL